VLCAVHHLAEYEMQVRLVLVAMASTRPTTTAAAPRELMQLKHCRGTHDVLLLLICTSDLNNEAAIVKDSASNARLTATVTEPLAYIRI
jgi:hypothetical protein